MKQTRSKGTALSFPAGLTIALGIALSLTVVQTALLTFLLTTEKISETHIGYGVMVILTVTAFISSLYAAYRIKHLHVWACLGAGGLYWITLMGSTALFFGSRFGVVWETGFMILLGSTLAVFCCKKGERLKYKSRRKREVSLTGK